jgi:hypothetical protein
MSVRPSIREPALDWPHCGAFTSANVVATLCTPRLDSPQNDPSGEVQSE